MRTNRFITIFFSLLLFCSITAQNVSDPILLSQKSAIETLAFRVGFTNESLDAHVVNVYGKHFYELSQAEGADLITIFQSSNPPKPGAMKAESEVQIPPKLVLADILEAGMSKRFHLIDGNVIRGTILEIVEGICKIETDDGILNIPTVDILEEKAQITKKDNTRYIGPVIRETPEEIVLRSKYGDVIISKKDIQTMDRYHGGKLVPWTEEKEKFYTGEAQLINVFLDPVAFTLSENTFYVSGLSLGYGFTDRFMLKTRFGSNFSGDLNIHPHFRFYHRQTGTHEVAVAWGSSFHRRYPFNTFVAKYSQAIIRNSDKMALNEIDSVNVSDVMVDSEERGTYVDMYIVYSQRRSRESGRGKVGWSMGAKAQLWPGKPELDSAYAWSSETAFKIPFRLWMSFEYDLRKNLKFVGSIWADNGNKARNLDVVADDYLSDDTPFVFDSPKGTYSMFDFDFGFLYAVSETFRFGVHFQQPYLDFYWEFYEF